VKRSLTLVVALLLVATGCTTDDPEGPTSTSSSTTTGAALAGTTTSTSTTAAPVALICDGPIPAFPTYLPALDPLDVEGTPGPGPGSRPVAGGQVVYHWQRDFGIIIEARWPGSVIPTNDAQTIASEFFEGFVAVPSAETGGNRVRATIVVGEDDSDPCSVVTVEAYGAEADPLFDEMLAFLESLRPLSQRSEYVAAVLASLSPVASSERPQGLCAEPVPTSVDEFGYPDETASRTLAERFLADRLSGKAAERCLTVAALKDYQPLELSPPLPGPCLFSCGDIIRVIDAELAKVTLERVQLLVTYRYGDGTELRLRESLAVKAIPAGDGGHTALIDGVWMGPESYVEDPAGRRVIEGLLDAIAAGEYEIAASFLVNEGFSEEVEERLGDLFSDPPDRLFSEFCTTAACGAPYTIGDTVALDEWSRTYRVVFETTDGPVPIDIRTGAFEGNVTAGNLPPDGTPAERAPRIDQRLFGIAYPGSLTIVRDRAVERVVAGRSEWSLMWRARLLERFGAVGGSIIEERWLDMGGGVYRLAIGSGVGDLLAASPAQLAGAAMAADRPVAFVTDGESLDAIDLATTFRETLRDFANLDETPYAADGANGTGRLLLTLGAGESTWFEIYEFNETTLRLGKLLTRIDPDGALGIGHLAPDAQTIATTYDDSWYDPVQTIALLDAADGSVLGRWTIAAPDSINSLDFDGRWIVAELSDGDLFVVDTESADVRRVTTTVRVRFG
jgi:hypothetical protein